MKYRAIVEDNKSPLKDGRVRVRIFGLHSEDPAEVKTDELPWAEVVHSNYFGFGSGIGITSIPRTGTWVFVELENDNPNRPIVVGAISGMSTETSKFDLPKASKLNKYDINTLAEAHYAEKHVIETFSGHTIEIDDFGGAEMIKITHSPSGTFIHMLPDGSVVLDVKKDLTCLVAGNTLIDTKGNTTVKTAGNTEFNTSGTTDIISGGAVTIQGSSINLN